MRRPNRDLVLPLLACCAAFAQGWQREREQRAERCADAACWPAKQTAAAAPSPAARAPVVRAVPPPDAADRGTALLARVRASSAGQLGAADVAALEALGTAGDPAAAQLLAELYADPLFPGADPDRAFDWMARYAELGDAAAKLDAAYRTLWDAPEDRPAWRERALGWLAAAAAGGSAEAALELLKLHDGEGERFGIARDAQHAERWYERLRQHADAAVLRDAALHYQSRRDPEATARAIELWALQGDRGGAFGSNNAAWLLAVCGGALADHERAWRLIQRELRDHGETWQAIDTLAGVQARLGMWGDALATQQRALDLLAASEGEDAAWYAPDLRQRLEGYAALQGPSEPGLCPSPP